MAAIHKAMIEVMKQVGSIGKTRMNDAQRYRFRGVDDVYFALQKLMASVGVYTTSDVLAERSEDRTTAKGSNLIYRVLTIKFTFHAAADDSEVSSVVIGEGMDSGDKATNKAMSVAHKYALLQAFMIPTDEAKDPENDNHDVVPKALPTDETIVARIKAATSRDDINAIWKPMTVDQRRAHADIVRQQTTFIDSARKAEVANA